MSSEKCLIDGTGEPDGVFWDQVVRKRLKLLALDYDGTLAPFREKPMDAVPLAGIPEYLEAIRRDRTTRLAVISGRPLAELDVLLGPLAREVITVGAHGWEMRCPGCTIGRASPVSSINQALERAGKTALELARRTMGEKGIDRIERKAASVAAHVRGVPAGEAEPFFTLLAERWNLETGRGLKIMVFDGGPLARHLRRAGFTGPMGFFLHVPFPSIEMIEILNDPFSFMDAWLDYDLVGFHTLFHIDRWLHIR